LLDVPPLMRPETSEGTTTPMEERDDQQAHASQPAPTWWRSLEQLENPDPAKAPTLREFEPGQFADDPDGKPSFDRRRFMQIMGASTALATAASCRWQESSIVPFAENPEGRIPGVAKYYATHLEIGGVAQPLVVTSYDGRPIKVEGNPEHPESMGAMTTFA
jgi:MoCo/4Fe-4S cofactor protein with predicted Tat translocation signal